MRSRSYYAVASSSLLLLSISCSPQNRKPKDAAPARVVERLDDVKSEAKADEKKAEVVVDEASLPPDADAGAEEQDDTGATESEGASDIHADGCADAEMKFEGKCAAKNEVSKILDRREQEALDKYRTAKKPIQAAEAANEFLEQQVAKIDKTEDDLDEIIEMLREEDKKRKKGPRKKRRP